jgi:hypothetical protein
MLYFFPKQILKPILKPLLIISIQFLERMNLLFALIGL